MIGIDGWAGMTAVINRNKTVEKLIMRHMAGENINPEMEAAMQGSSRMVAFEQKRKRCIADFEQEKRQKLIVKKRKSVARLQSYRDKLNNIDLELDDEELGRMDLKGLKDQVRKFKAENVWDDAHKKIVDVLKHVNLGSDISPKYENDYARERSRYLDILGMAIAYRVSDGADLRVIRIAGLERQGEQHDPRPPPKRRKKAAAAGDIGDTTNAA